MFVISNSIVLCLLNHFIVDNLILKLALVTK